VLKDIPRRFLKAIRIAGPQQRVQEDVIGLESRVGLKLTAPVAVFVLLREEVVAGAANRGRDPAA